jgi:hypothetical protein
VAAGFAGSDQYTHMSVLHIAADSALPHFPALSLVNYNLNPITCRLLQLFGTCMPSPTPPPPHPPT